MNKPIWMAVVLVGSACATEALLVSVQPQPISPVTLSYGPDARNTLDLWKAGGSKPNPLLVYIHGGSWTGNDKSQVFQYVDVTNWLEKGVSVASIDYRYSTDAILPAPVHDAARAIQFLRRNAAELHIDSSHIALIGSSAGGCSAVWLLFHDDLADPTASDPVLRESTRVQGAWGQIPQTSIDPVVLTNWIGELAASHHMIYQAVGAANYAAMMANYAQYKPLLDEFSPINHMDAGDPPLFLTYSANMTLPPATPAAAIHHGTFGVKLKEKAAAIGYAKLDLLIKGTSVPEHYATVEAFLDAILLEGK
ncbi:MAG: alpha/beta hydrolase [Kiritimatiellales bacterium]|nr:alpha/beta hydrolase [Kiritimatiellales bacterium]